MRTRRLEKTRAQAQVLAQLVLRKEQMAMRLVRASLGKARLTLSQGATQPSHWRTPTRIPHRKAGLAAAAQPALVEKATEDTRR